ncbi:MAG: hypothetical protein IPM66_21600 [Acidobacteriota bacterium]|nr:MAG: hypothetical protein IPM66_21600 [Acidobacteriota bacterium]
MSAHLSAVTSQIAQAQGHTRFKVLASLKGFPVEIEFEGKADALLSLIDRLEQIGAHPPGPQSSTVSTAPAVPPVCPVHKKTMKPSRKPGSFFCPGKNPDGSFCDEKA